MFPFVIKGKVPLGLRREYQLSAAGLQERISERLVEKPSRSRIRPDGSPSGDGRGLLAEGMSRLKSMGFLSTVRVRRVRITSLNDHLFARYEMDCTASSLINLVLVPLVLGSVLFAHPRFGFYESLAILVLLVLASWGLDTLMLVMMVRHEIAQIASEVRSVVFRRDVLEVDDHHRDLSPEDLLTTAYYFERNGLVLRCEAYLAHLMAAHPDSFEATLAREHIRILDEVPARPDRGRDREGGKESPPSRDRKRSGKGRARGRTQGGNLRTGTDGGPSGRGAKPRGRTGRRRLLAFLRRDRVDQDPPGGYRRKTGPGGRRRTAEGLTEAVPKERVVRRRHERLRRREDLARTARNDKPDLWTRFKLRVSALLRREDREERAYRRKQQRWLHGPRASEPSDAGDRTAARRRLKRPNWMRPREERQALEREMRWSQGPRDAAGIQRSRDRWGRWRLRGAENREERRARERRVRAAQEPPYA